MSRRRTHAWRYVTGKNDPTIPQEATEFGNEAQKRQRRLGRMLTACEVLQLAKDLGYRKVPAEGMHDG
jgi:hypothetical protein